LGLAIGEGCGVAEAGAPLKCACDGGRVGAPTRAEVEAFLGV